MHLLSWRVTSADGHPVGGSLTFSIGQPTEAPAFPQASADPRLRGAIWLARLVLYLGLFVGVGGAFYAAFIGTAHARGPTIGALAGGLIAGFLSFGLHGVDLLGLPPSSLHQTAVWASALTSTYGLTLCIAITALILGLAAVTAERSGARWYSALALIALGGPGRCCRSRWLCARGTAAPSWHASPRRSHGRSVHSSQAASCSQSLSYNRSRRYGPRPMA
jgi:copper transport protein